MTNATASLLTRNVELFFNNNDNPSIEMDSFVKEEYFKIGGDTQRILNLLEEE